MPISVVVPIGVIVAVAIVFVIIAVLSSAQRTNDVALDNEQQLFMRALIDRGERACEMDSEMLREIAWRLGFVGDELLRSVAQRLIRTLRGDDLVTRLGGDEFAVLTAAALEHATLQAVGKRMIDAICAPFFIGNQSIAIGASIEWRRAGCHASRRHGALSRQERRPQPRLHLRLGHGRRAGQAQGA